MINRRSNKRWVAVTLVTLVVLLFVAPACKREQELPLVRYRGGWLPTPMNVADWAALGEGYFAEDGLEVKVTKGTGQEDATMLVAAGEYDIGMSAAVPAIMGLAQGMPIRVVAMIYQRNTLGMMALKGSGVQTPKDIEGKRVAVYPQGESFAMWRKFVESNDLDLSAIEEVVSPYGLEPLLAGQVDLKPCGVGYEPFMVDETVVFPFSDYAGIDRYMDCLIVNNEFAAQHPDQVRTFVKAFLRGMVFATENPRQAAEHLLAYSDAEELGISREGVYKACERMTELFVSEDTEVHGLGYSTPQKWQEVVAFLIAEGVLEKPIAVEDIFTNEYLPEPPILMP